MRMEQESGNLVWFQQANGSTPGNLRAGPFGRTVKDARHFLKQLKDIFVLRAAHADWDIRFKRLFFGGLCGVTYVLKKIDRIPCTKFFAFAGGRTCDQVATHLW